MRRVASTVCEYPPRSESRGATEQRRVAQRFYGYQFDFGNGDLPRTFVGGAVLLVEVPRDVDDQGDDGNGGDRNSYDLSDNHPSTVVVFFFQVVVVCNHSNIFVSENCNFALLLLVVVLYLVESTKLQTVDKSIKLKKQQLLIQPRIALENILKYLFPLCSFHS